MNIGLEKSRKFAIRIYNLYKHLCDTKREYTLANTLAKQLLRSGTSIGANLSEYADCYMAMSLSGSSFVVSPKLYPILYSLNIEGIQFIPVTLMEDNEVKYTGFIYIHTYNFLPVLSVKKSRYQEHNGIKNRNNLLEIKFNNKKLCKINLENRLIFRLPLDRGYFIFHVSVAEKIMSVNPIGIQLIKISDINYPNTDGIFI